MQLVCSLQEGPPELLPELAHFKLCKLKVVASTSKCDHNNKLIPTVAQEMFIS